MATDLMANGRQVRVRMAPSPTGPLHVGGARTALFNWLFARHHGGAFILRIEDTDVTRSTEENVHSILRSLRWLGLEWDEGPEIGGPYGPYFQMQRLDSYREALSRLLESEAAYYCYCTPEELEAERAAARASHTAYRYSRRCRSLTAAQRAAFEAQGRRPVVRFKMPDEGQTSFHDLIRGEITFENRELDDLVIVKSDGIPTYNFAAVVDDATMLISHVIRGEDHIANTPKQILIYQALGWPVPAFAHLPMILGPDRSKLSKRHGATSLTDYAEAGYLPEAMMNFLALLGWSYDDKQEIFSKQELIEYFQLERVGKTGAIFNIEKLDWMNGYYLRQMSIDDLVVRAVPFLQRAGLLPPDPLSEETYQHVRRVLTLVQERVKRLGELPELTQFFFEEQLSYDPTLLVSKGMEPRQTRAALEAALGAIAAVEPFAAEPLEATLRPLATELGLKAGQLFGSLRVAITGRTVAPPLFQTMDVLGRTLTLRRIEQAIRLLPAS